MKLSHWAKKNGISYLTAWNWFKAGTLPVKSYQTASSTIIVQDTENSSTIQENIVIYARVSSYGQKENLDRQILRCEEFALAKGLSITKTYKEIASGMNDKRKNFYRMLESNPTKIIVEHKDRLTRFGFNYLEYLLKKQNCEIIVINRDHENDNDLIKDMISIVTSFCCRLYGIRRAKYKVEKIRNIVKNNKITKEVKESSKNNIK